MITIKLRKKIRKFLNFKDFYILIYFFFIMIFIIKRKLKDMKYIHKFDSESAFTAFKSSSEYLEPNVALTEDDNIVHYNRITNGHEYVDLGLPSGTKWATTNVGAKSPEEYGLFFQWGDTVGYSGITTDKKFEWGDYKYSAESKDGSEFSKYSESTDADMTLDLSDDAAHVNMGGDWHMPSSTQINELINNTTHTPETIGTVKGMRYTSKKDTSKSIFVPFAGYCNFGSHNGVGNFGYCWSSSRNSDVGYGYYLSCHNNAGTWLSSYYRCYGFSVRGVLG